MMKGVNNLKDVTELLSERYSVRFTWAEKQLIAQLAEAHGMKPTALIRDVIRQCLLSQEVGMDDGNELEQGSPD